MNTFPYRPLGLVLWVFIAAVLWIVGGLGTAGADDIQVNTYITGHQSHPSVAMDSDGDFVVVWHSGSVFSYNIQGQLFASDGSIVGGEFQVNTYTTNRQRFPSVTMDADGDFVVVWHSNGSVGTDTFYSIQGQRYASDGSAVGGEFQVNTYTTYQQRYPSVGLDAGGDFVVVWHSNGSAGTDSSQYSIQGQRYASDGSAVGGEFQVNTYTTGLQLRASVAIDFDGDFVVVWDSYGSAGTDSSGWSIQGQRYTSEGSPVSGEFQVNTYTTGFQLIPSVSIDTAGDLVVVWWSDGSSGTDGSYSSIQGQRYASDGSPVGGEFQVNTYTTSQQRYPSVGLDAGGDFVVVWHSNGSAGTDSSQYSIQGQRYASDGSAVGGEFQVNTYTTGLQLRASVAIDFDGDFVVVWRSDGSSGTDTDGNSVQRTAVELIFADGFESGDTTAWSSAVP